MAAEDPGYKVLAMLIAFTAWFWVQSQETDQARLRVNVRYELPEGLVNVDPLLSTATVVAQGPRVSIRRAQQQRPTIHVDLREEGVGTYEARLDAYEMEGRPSSLTIVAFSPDLVPVRLDERIVESLPVMPRWIGRPAEDHAVVGVRVTPEVVEVTGPRVALRDVDAIDTMNIDVSEWSETRTVPVDLDLPRGVTTTTEWQGEATVQIDSLVSTRQLAEVLVVVPDPDWRAAEGSRAIPVKLVGPTDVLRALRPDQVLARVDLPADPAGDRYIAVYLADRPPRYEVIIPREDVRVAAPPPDIEVERR